MSTPAEPTVQQQLTALSADLRRLVNQDRDALVPPAQLRDAQQIIGQAVRTIEPAADVDSTSSSTAPERPMLARDLAIAIDLLTKATASC